MNFSLKLLVVLLALGSCSEEVPLEKIDVGQEFALKAGEYIDLMDSSTFLARVQVTEITDSRCPVNANCIRAGEADVTINMSRASQNPLSHDFCIGECPQRNSSNTTIDQAVLQIENIYITITLIAVDPFPSLDEPEIEHSATFLFESYSIDQ